MYQRFKMFFCHLVETIKQTPLEFGVALLYWLLCLLDYWKVVEIGDFGATFPICFGLIYSIDQFTKGSPKRWLYYASFVIPVWLGIWELPFPSATYWVSLLISQLFVVFSRKYYENKLFIRNGMNYLCDMAVAVCLGIVCHLLLLAIYYSFIYIFDLSDSFRGFNTYTYLTVYLVFVPVFFLAFNTRPISGETEISRFARFLVNFILSPALLAYMLLLYLYLIKIVVTWSLPKGGVAYMVTSFIALMYCVKAIHSFMEKRYYDWFYRYFSWWVLPALTMLWVGVAYRVWQYGLTEKRFYLLLSAVILTIVVAVSFKTFRRSYAYLTGISAALLALFTYIPGVTAKDIGVMSQHRYLDRYLAELGISDSLGRIVKPTSPYDPVSAPLYEGLYESFRFLEKEKGQDYMSEHYGIATWRILRDSIIPADLQDSLLPKRSGKDQFFLFFDYKALTGMDIRRFSSICEVGQEDLIVKEYSAIQEEGILTVKKQDKVIAEIDLDRWFAGRLAETGIQPGYTRQELVDHENRFIACDTGGIRLIFRRLIIEPATNHVVEAEINFLLAE